MANLRKNKINQVLFVMVDKTDFATIESGITASDFTSAATVKFFGANHKDSAFTSLTPATVISLVHSGIFKQMLTAAECVYDIGMIHITHASCADQNMLLEFTEIGSAVWAAPYSNYVVASTMGSALGHTASRLVSLQSDVISMISTVSQLRVRMNWSTVSDLASKITSRVWAADLAGTSMASNIASQVWAHTIGARVDSRLVKTQSTASNANSYLQTTLSSKISGLSDILSAVYVQTTSMHSQTSNVNSKVIKMQSVLSDLHSVFGSRVPKLAANASNLSNYYSSLRSQIGGVAAATVSVSNISDIASAVWAYKMASQTGAGTCGSALNRTSNIWSLISDITSALATTATASDVASAVWAQKWDIHSTASTFGSRIAKWAESGINIRPSDMSSISNYAAAITAADMSNIASRVWSAKYTAHSVASSFGSLMSDMYSRIVKTQSTSSNVNSKLISMAGSSISGISDILSKIYVQTTSMTSDIISMISTVSQLRVRMNWSTASDLTSKITSKVWGFGKATSLLSYGAVAASGASLIPGMSDILSKVYVHTTSITSDVISMISTISQLRVRTNWSNVSDLTSKISSNVWGVKWDVHSVASSFGSAFEWLLKRASYISDISSKTLSMLTGASWMSNLGSVFWNDTSGLSDMASRTASMVWIHTKGASALSLLSQLRVRAAYSTVSDLTSKIAVANWGVKWDVHSTASSFGSAFEVLNSRVSALRVRAGYSTTSDLQSGIVSAIWAASVSTFKTGAASFGSRFAKLTTSDALSKAQSDINSHISGLTVNAVTASDISDIASAVWGASISTLKGVAASFGSRFAKLTTSDALSKTQSKINSHVSGVTATIGAADMSNIASRVWSAKYTAHSVASSFGSLMSDMYSRIVKTQSTASRANSVCLSMISTVSATYALATSIASSVSTISKIYSQVASVTSAISTISLMYIQSTSTVSAAQAVRSKLASFVTNYASYMSDISSRVWATAIGTTVVSRVSDMYSYLSDFNTHGVDLTASAISDIRSTLDACLDSAFTDATGLTGDGLKERIRRMDWILQNKMRVIKASGNTLIYKDDNATTGLSTAGALTSDATSVVRKRMV